eukprot:m51a1_g8605 hypothetical protein (242) ;mRNA; r:192580-193357
MLAMKRLPFDSAKEVVEAVRRSMAGRDASVPTVSVTLCAEAVELYATFRPDKDGISTNHDAACRPGVLRGAQAPLMPSRPERPDTDDEGSGAEEQQPSDSDDGGSDDLLSDMHDCLTYGLAAVESMPLCVLARELSTLFWDAVEQCLVVADFKTSMNTSASNNKLFCRRRHAVQLHLYAVLLHAVVWKISVRKAVRWLARGSKSPIVGYLLILGYRAETSDFVRIRIEPNYEEFLPWDREA